MTTPPSDWEIPRKIWMILVSWGLALLMVVGLLSGWIWTNQKNSEAERDGALCALISIFLTGPEPVQGPAGDRSRSVRDGMRAYQSALRCTDFTRPE